MKKVFVFTLLLFIFSSLAQANQSGSFIVYVDYVAYKPLLPEPTTTAYQYPDFRQGDALVITRIAVQNIGSVTANITIKISVLTPTEHGSWPGLSEVRFENILPGTISEKNGTYDSPAGKAHCCRLDLTELGTWKLLMDVVFSASNNSGFGYNVYYNNVGGLGGQLQPFQVHSRTELQSQELGQKALDLNKKLESLTVLLIVLAVIGLFGPIGGFIRDAWKKLGEKIFGVIALAYAFVPLSFLLRTPQQPILGLNPQLTILLEVAGFVLFLTVGALFSLGRTRKLKALFPAIYPSILGGLTILNFLTTIVDFWLWTLDYNVWSFLAALCYAIFEIMLIMLILNLHYKNKGKEKKRKSLSKF